MAMTVADIAVALRGVARAASAGDFEPALETIVELARLEQLVEIVRCVLSDPDASARSAPMSFIHVLGFAKFVLVNEQPDFMLRMHVWHPDAGRTLGHIHDHRDAIVSTVVCGALEKHIFVRDPTASRAIEYREECDEDGWMLRPVGMTGLRRVQVTTLERGGHYALAPDVLHRISGARDRLTMTLLLETAVVKTTTTVFVGKGERPPERRRKVPLTPADYARGLSDALAALRCSQPTTPA